jgi:hypothetical protein
MLIHTRSRDLARIFEPKLRSLPPRQPTPWAANGGKREREGSGQDCVETIDLVYIKTADEGLPPFLFLQDT